MSSTRRIAVSATPQHAIQGDDGKVSFAAVTESIAYGRMNGRPYAEIAPCRFDGDSIERVDAADAQFWTVYTRHPERVGKETQYLAQAISDHESREHALSFALNGIGEDAEIVFWRESVNPTVDLTGEEATLTVDWESGEPVRFTGITDHGLATFSRADTAEYRDFMAKNGLEGKPEAIDWIMVSGTHIDGSPEVAEVDARGDFLHMTMEDNAISP